MNSLSKRRSKQAQSSAILKVVMHNLTKPSKVPGTGGNLNGGVLVFQCLLSALLWLSLEVTLVIKQITTNAEDHYPSLNPGVDPSNSDLEFLWPRKASVELDLKQALLQMNH